MAMIKCSECGQEISDKASECINCGCPIKQCSNIVNDKKNKSEYNVVKGLIKFAIFCFATPIIMFFFFIIICKLL